MRWTQSLGPVARIATMELGRVAPRARWTGAGIALLLVGMATFFDRYPILSCR